MNLAPLFTAPLAVQVHTFAALAAALFGLVQLTAPIRPWLHRPLGWTWVLLMLTTAISSVFIVDFANLRPTAAILVLSVVVVGQLVVAIRAIRARDVDGHRRTMRGLYVGALLIAGAFTLLPGRLLSSVLFG